MLWRTAAEAAGQWPAQPLVQPQYCRHAHSLLHTAAAAARDTQNLTAGGKQQLQQPGNTRIWQAQPVMLRVVVHEQPQTAAAKGSTGTGFR